MLAKGPFRKLSKAQKEAVALRLGYASLADAERITRLENGSRFERFTVDFDYGDIKMFFVDRWEVVKDIDAYAWCHDNWTDEVPACEPVPPLVFILWPHMHKEYIANKLLRIVNELEEMENTEE